MTARALALALLLPAAAQALPVGQAMHKPVPPAGNAEVPKPLQEVEVVEKLGQALPLEARFTAEDGKPVLLGELLRHERKPTVVALVYYSCPMLCGLVLTGLARGMKETGLELGRDYQAVTISFDPRDTTADAAQRQRRMLQAVGRPEATSAWRFLTGAEPDIHAVTEAVGFKYAYDEKTKQYAHAAAIVVTTPDGRVSRYLYGVEFASKDLRLALVEASAGRVGTSFDKLLLTCFRYDPDSRKYEPYALGFVRLAMLGVLGGVAVMLGVFWRREARWSKGERGAKAAKDADAEAAAAKDEKGDRGRSDGES
jgi:protein SCO1/2